MPGPPDDDYLGRALDNYRGRAPTDAPPVPAQDDPKVQESEARLLRTAIERFSLADPGPDGQANAAALTDKIVDRPTAIAAKPTLLEQLTLSVMPRRVRPDGRPQTLADVPEYLRREFKNEVVSVIDPIGVWGRLGAWSNDPDVGTDAQGLPAENEAMWALRVIGSAAPALVTETVKRAPTPDVAGAARAAKEGDLAEAAARFFSPSTVGEQVLGWDPNDTLRVPRDNAAANWLQAVLEKVERGDGFEVDMAQTAKTRLGEEWETVGWGIGLAIDSLTNWEGAVANTATAIPKLVQRMKALGEIAPSLRGLEKFAAAVRGGEIDLAGWAASKVVDDFESGKIGPDDLPPDVRVALDEVSVREYDETIAELLEDAGVVPAPRVVDPEFQAVQDDLAAAAKEFEATAPKAADAPDPDAPVRTTRRRGQPRGPQRPPLPDPSIKKAPKNAAGAWRYAAQANADKAAPPTGYSLPRGRLGQVIPGTTESTVEDAVYQLRNAQGDVLRSGTMADVLDELRRKPRAGDEIWYGDVRPVARWARTKPKYVQPAMYRRKGTDDREWALTHDFHFSTASERELVAAAARLDPDAGKKIPITDPAGAAKAGETLPPAEALRRALADVVTRAPAKSAQPKTDAGRALVEAFRVAMARKMDSRRFTQLPNGAMVPTAEYRRYLDDTHRVLGMSGARARDVIAGAKPTDLEAERLAAVADRYKVDVSAGLTPESWLAMRNAVLRDVGGSLADIRYRIQGTQGFVDRVFGAISDLHLDRRLVGPVRKYLRRSAVGSLTKALLDDKLARLPQPIRARLKELRVGLERNLDDMITEYQAAGKDLTRTERLLRMIGGYDVVAPEITRQAVRVVAGVDQDTLYDVVRSLPTRPRWAEWQDPVAQMDAALGWSRRIRAEAAVQGREWVRSLLLTRGDEAVGTLDAQLIDELDEALALKVYDEVFDSGELLGDATQEALRSLRTIPGGLDETQALITHAIRMRADVLIDRAMEDLISSGMAVRRSDVRRSALSAVLKGTHRVWDKAHERWVYLFPEAQISWAHERLVDWGIDVGADAAIKPTRLGRRDVLVPAYLADELKRLVNSANADSRTVYDSKLFDDLLRLTKEFTTHGVILPNPGYFMGQMIGIWPTMFTSRGLSGTVDVARQFLRHPLETREIMRRLGKGPLYQNRSASVFVTDAGDVISYDQLEDVARRMGLQDTPASFEAAARFREFVAQEDNLGWMSPRRLKFAAGAWQQMIREWAGTFDQAARVSAYIADVKRGIPLEQAALNAREQLLDFRALTEVESRWGRRIFMFYAFMRKNSDAYIKAAFHHPARVAAQMRIAHASLTESGLSDLELAGMREDDLGRLVVYQDEDVVNDEGRVHPLYRMNRLSTTPMGVVEALLTLRAFTGRDTEKLLGWFNPAITSMGILLQGRKPDREFDSPSANRIAPWLVEFPALGPWIRGVFGVGPMPLRDTDDPMLDDEDATAEIGSGVPAVWVAGGDPGLTPEQRYAARRNWQLLRAWLGRPIGTAEDVAQVMGWQEIDPNITWEEHALATSLGLRWVPVLDEEEAIRRGLLKRARRMEETAAELRVPR